MKRLLLSIPAMATMVLANAQNFSITDGSGNLTGTNVNYFVPNNVSDTRIYTVTNTTSNSYIIKMKKVNVQLNDAGATTWFCTDQNCYTPTATYSLVVNMNPNGTFQLSCDFNPNNMNGTTIVRYTVVDQNDPNDTAFFTITYNVSPSGIHANAALKPSVSEPMPNPVANMFSMNFKLNSTPVNGTRFVIYNMLGAAVAEKEVMEAEGVLKMDVSDLEAGIYFCSLVSDGKTLATKRLVVSH